MGELVFIGLGLSDEKDISVRGIQEAKSADWVYAELYTSIMTSLSLKNLERMIGKKINILTRGDLEEGSGELILTKAEMSRVALFVPGDPMIATTHVDLRIRAEKRGVKTFLIHGSSIVSAVMGLSGLQNYRFGKSVTVPFPYERPISQTPYDVVLDNKNRNLHSLCFLDLDYKNNRSMSINEGLQLFLDLEEIREENVATPNSMAVGIARAGSKNVVVKAGKVKDLKSFEFGRTPHILIMPAEKLHFMEAEALITLADGPKECKLMVG